MKNVQSFFYSGQQVRTVIDEDGNPWWVAKDVCEILGLANITMALQSLDGDELTSIKLKSGIQSREMKVINEPGLYTLIIRSNKPEAKTFKRWITHEVLPAIRKTGRYEAPGYENIMSDTSIRKSGTMYFPMAKLVASADKFLEGKAALKALNYFTGMPVDDLLDELEEKQRVTGFVNDQDSGVDPGILGFVRAKCSLDMEGMVNKRELFDAYRDYCSDTLKPSLGREAFFKGLYNTCKSLTSSRLRQENERTYFVKGIRIVKV